MPFARVIENMEALPATIEGNRQVLTWLRGDRQWSDDAADRYRRVQLIDFENPSNNSFHVTWEWTLKPPARKGNSADVTCLVNGVPVTIVEHKNPKDAERHGAPGSPSCDTTRSKRRNLRLWRSYSM